MFQIPFMGRVVLILGMVVVGGAAGWTINGWRLQSNIEALKATHAEEVSKLLLEARQRDSELLSNAEKLRKDKDAKIKKLNSRLSSALGELQHRKNRSSYDPTSAAACSGTTGAYLSKEDAEFLTRFAAEADRVVENLNYCIHQYNSLPAK